MRVILWLTLAMGLHAQKEVLNLASSPRADDHPQLQELLKIKRVFVEKLAGGDTAVHFRDMLISSLQESRLFVITENAERADTILRGSAEDLVFTETFSSSEGVQGRAQIGGLRTTGTMRGASGVSVGEHESVRIAERRHEATASVRLVNKDGDVIWSTTQESLGGKFRGASADAASKITRALAEDYARARNLSSKSGPASAGR
jgi:hypothetical protein